MFILLRALPRRKYSRCAGGACGCGKSGQNFGSRLTTGTKARPDDAAVLAAAGAHSLRWNERSFSKRRTDISDHTPILGNACRVSVSYGDQHALNDADDRALSGLAASH